MSKGPAIGDWTQYGWIPDDVSSFPARIRLRNAAWMVYYEPDIVVQQERDEMLELQAENAKLRELVRAMKPFLCCMPFVSCDTLAANVRSRMRELGIEVEG